MTDSDTVLLVTIGDAGDVYERGREAIRALQGGGQIEQPASLTFANERQLGEVFNERTYELLRVIRDEEPESIRETARLVDRDKKNVHQELTTLEALGVVRFEENGQAKRPVFPYDDLVISPLAAEGDDGGTAVP